MSRNNDRPAARQGEQTPRKHKARAAARPAHTSGLAIPRPAGRVASRAVRSPGEVSVLGVFRRFRMGPGQMLCFSRADSQTYKASLARLVDDGLLVAERFQGGFSLTSAGFAAMRESE